MMESRNGRAARYRAEAERLLQEAAGLPDSSMREQLLDIARQYERLADTVEWLGRTE